MLRHAGYNNINPNRRFSVKTRQLIPDTVAHITYTTISNDTGTPSRVSSQHGHGNSKVTTSNTAVYLVVPDQTGLCVAFTEQKSKKLKTASTEPRREVCEKRGPIFTWFYSGPFVLTHPLSCLPLSVYSDPFLQKGS